jgi:hypothetical protein
VIDVQRFITTRGARSTSATPASVRRLSGSRSDVRVQVVEPVHVLRADIV